MDLRKERTLKNLSESLFELILEKRYGDITVAEVCERAMVRRATFYRHFSSKDDLLKYVIRGQRMQIEQRVDPDRSLPLRDFCMEMTEALLCFIEEHQTLLRKASAASDLSFVSMLVAQEISKEFSKRLEPCSPESTPTESTKLLADFYTFGLFGSIEQVFERGEEFKKEKLLQSLQDIFDRLFTTQG